jgi:hypothetical protein
MTPSPDGLVSPEKRLLASCARLTVEPPIAREIRELCAAPLDWEFVVNEAAVNSILPLVARQISAVAADIAPPDQIERLTKAARSNALRCLTLTAELIKIMDLLREAGIQAMPYKGPVLAVQAYGDVALREFEDLDIILRQRDMAKVDEIAKSLAYRPNHAWVFDSGSLSAVVPGEYDYRDEARGMVVEFHTEFTLRHFPVRPDLDEMSRRLVPVLLSGHEIRTLADEDMLPILCIHGSKDFWERISWIADISEFVRSHPQLDWETLFRLADARRAGRMLRVGLALAVQLLSARLPEEVSARVRRDPVAEAVASEIAQRHLNREPHERGAAERFHFRRRMVAGAIAGWRYSARLTTQPADEDSASMRLPRPLAPLYTVLRPFRLLRQYGASGPRSERHT